MAEGIGVPVILHGKENQLRMTLKLEEIVCKEKQSVKNELKLSSIENVNSATNENKTLLRTPCKSINSFENHVGKLNEICSKRSIRGPDYDVSVTENGEFIIQCKMFDNSVTQGRSKSKKDAKQEAAEAMLRVLNEREEAKCQEFSELREYAENISVPIVKLEKNINAKLNPSVQAFTNNVGKLNEIYFKNYQQRPSYRLCGTENGEFIIECAIFDSTVTRGQAKSKKDAKQKAAEAMLFLLKNRESQNKIRDESMGSNHMEFIKPARNLTENVSIRLSSPTDAFENHVGTVNKISSTSERNESLDLDRETGNWDFMNGCEIIDNTHEQPRFKIYTVKEMLDILNNNEDLMKDSEESQCQKPVEILKCAKSLTNSTLNVRENIIVKTENPEFVTECPKMEQQNFKKVEKPKAGEVLLGVLNNNEKWKSDREEVRKDRKESMNDGEKSTYQNDMELIKHARNFSNATVNLTENGSIRLSAPTKPSNKIYYKSKPKYLSKRVCGTDHWKQPKPKAAEAMLSSLNDSKKLRNDGKARYNDDMQLIKYAKNISNSTLNGIGNENFRLSSEQCEHHVETRNETYYRNKKKHLTHRVSFSGKSRYQKNVKFMRHTKNLANLTLNASENVSVELSSPIEQFGNHVGKSNKTCYKSKKHLLSRVYGIENVEFTTECNIFEDTVMQEQLNINKAMERNASVEFFDLLRDSEALGKDKQESMVQKQMEFYKCAKTFPIASLNVRKRRRFQLNSRAETFHNYVKTLNEECGKKHKQYPWYRGGKTKNGEFIIECIIDDTITRGQSRSENGAKQNAAQEMVKILARSGKMQKQQSRESLEKYKVSKSQRKPLVGLDTNIIVERNDVPSILPNKRTTLVTKNSSNNTSSVQFENYVGKLNEICFNEGLMHPLYTSFKLDSGEFIIKCEMVDKTCSHGCSKTKKEAKQEAAKAMIKVISKNQRQRDTKSSQIDKCPELLSNVAEKSNICSKADILSSSTDENDNLLESSVVSFENHVGKLIEICIKNACEGPTYIEVSEDGEFRCECKVINNAVEIVTQGQSMIRKDAKQRASQAMIEILNENSKFEDRNLMKSVTIIDTTDCSQQKPMKELNNQSDLSSLKYMNERELKMELDDLNVSYTITAVKRTFNALRLKTQRTEDYKSLTFISTGENLRKVSLNLLRKAVFGLRILKK